MTKRRSSYWQERVAEMLDKAYRRTNEQAEAELARVYAEAAEGMRADILKVFAKIEADKGAGEPIAANDLYRNRRYWALLDEVNKRLEKLGRDQIRITEPAIRQAYKETESLIEEGLPQGLVPVSFLAPSAIDGDTIADASWALDGKRFSDRVWKDKQALLPQIKKALADSLARGKSPWEIAKAMSDRLDVSRTNAYRLVRTETAHAQNYSQTQKYKRYGFTHGRFMASPGCCEECAKLDGTLHTLDELETLIPVHPWCRCTYRLEEGPK